MRSTADLTGGLGITTISLGLFYNAARALAHSLSEDAEREDYKVAISPYIV